MPKMSVPAHQDAVYFFIALSALHSKTVFCMKLKRKKSLQSSQSRLILKPDT